LELTQLQQGFATGEMGFRVKLRGSNFEPLMSALGQKQTSAYVRVMSALPPKADVAERHGGYFDSMLICCSTTTGSMNANVEPLPA
jgi:hypothetical protein